MNKRLLITLAGAAFCFAAAPAVAADLPVKAARVAPARPICLWCGVYVGVNAGYAWGHTDLTLTPTGQWPQDPNAPLFASLGSSGSKHHGFSGGGQVGINSQWNNLVIGLEGDIQYIGLKSSRIIGPVTGVPPFPGAAATTFSFQDSTKSTWVSTIRPRIGFAAGSALIYATGGLAFGEQRFSQSYTVVNTFPAVPAALTFNSVGAGSSTRLGAGWTAGGGIEWMFAPNWSIKGEYLHIELDTQSFNSALSTPFQGFTARHETRVTADIARAGVNYRFWTY
jgi:outer membrane immunogenic protein